MKCGIVLCLVWILITPWVQGQSQPQLSAHPAIPGETVKYGQQIELWSHGPWALDVSTDLFDSAILWDGRWKPMPLRLSSEHSQQENTQFAIAITTPWDGPGSYSTSFSIQWVKGVLLIYYVDDETLYLLPLGSHEFRVIWGLDQQMLVPGDWVCYPLDDYLDITVVFQETTIWEQRSEPTLTGMNQVGAGDSIRWLQQGIAPIVGEVYSLDLEVASKSWDQLLYLEFCSSLLPMDAWMINGEQVELRQEQGYYRIDGQPDLGVGPFRVQGQVMPLIVANSDPAWIRAFWGESSCFIQGPVKRGWFGDQGMGIVKVVADDMSLAYHRFLLPDGRVAFSDSQGILVFRDDPGLTRLISLDRDYDPIWLNLRSNQISHIFLDLSEAEPNRSMRAIWDLSWDEELLWQFGVYGSSVQWVVGGVPWQIQGDSSIRLDMAGREYQASLSYTALDRDSRLSLQLTPAGYSEQASLGQWLWQGSNWQWTGQYTQRSVQFHTYVDGSRLSPRWNMGMDIGRTWRLRIRDGNLSVYRTTGRFAAGIFYQRHKPPNLWLRDQPSGWQLSVKPTSWRIQGPLPWGRAPSLLTLSRSRSGDVAGNIHYGHNQEYQLEIEQRSQQLYLGLKNQRYIPLSWADLSWQIAAVHSEGIWQTELVSHLCKPLFPGGEVTVMGGNQWARGRSQALYGWDVSLDLGSVGQASLGWSSREGVHVRWGVALVSVEQ